LLLGLPRTVRLCLLLFVVAHRHDHQIKSISSKVETNETTITTSATTTTTKTTMMEHTALNGTASTIIKDQEEWKQKKGYGPLILFAVLLLGGAFYAGQSRSTIRGATTAASLTMMSNDAELEYMGHPTCVKSEGTYDSQKDSCYTCGSREKGTLGYCWNSQTPQCPPACDNVQGVSGIGDNQCGGPCDGFLSYKAVRTQALCEGMGYKWFTLECDGKDCAITGVGSCGAPEGFGY